MKRVSITNVLAVLVALFIGAYCSGCASVPRLSEDALRENMVVEFQELEPRHIHLGIYEDVADCLGEDAGEHPVLWGVARLLISPYQRALAYGVFGWMTYSDGAKRATIILDREYVYHPTVVSHEAVHAIAGVHDGNPLLLHCAMWVPPELERRPFPPDSIAHYRSLLRVGV